MTTTATIQMPDVNILHWGFNRNRISFFPVMFNEDMNTMGVMAAYFYNLLSIPISNLPEIDFRMEYVNKANVIPTYTGVIKEAIEGSMDLGDYANRKSIPKEFVKSWKSEIEKSVDWIREILKEGTDENIKKHLYMMIYLKGLYNLFRDKGKELLFDKILENAIVVLDLSYQAYCLTRTRPELCQFNFTGKMEILESYHLPENHNILYLYTTTFPTSQPQFDIQTATMYEMNLWAKNNGFEKGSTNQQDLFSALAFKDIYNVFGYYYMYNHRDFTKNEVEDIYGEFNNTLEKSLKKNKLNYKDDGFMRTNKEGKKYIIMH